MATRLIGTDSDLPRLPAVVIAATQGTTAADLAPGDVLADANSYTDAAFAAIPAALFVDVREFGVVADGTTDDSAAVQAAVDSLGGARGIVQFPRGTLLFNANLDPKRALLSGQGKQPNTGGGGTNLKFNSTFGIRSTIEDNTSWQARDMTITGSGDRVTNGQILVDFTGNNCPRLSNVRLDQSHYGLRLAKGTTIECNYGLFDQLDIWRCTRGVDFGNGTIGANSHTFNGGRLWTCTTGWYIDATVNNIVGTGVAFECGSGATAVDSAGSDVTFTGCRFETLNINLSVRSGAGRHWLFGCHQGSGFAVVDANTPTVVQGVSYVTQVGAAVPAAGGGINIAANGAFLHAVTGWSHTYSSLGTGYTFTGASGDATVDTYATLNNTGATNPRAMQSFTVIPNEPLAVRFKVRSSVSNFTVRCSATNAGSEWMNVVVPTDGIWHEYRAVVTPTSATMFFVLYRNTAVAGTCDITDVSISSGRQPLPTWQPQALTEAILAHKGTTAGFFSATPIAKPTGVAVTAAGIHAALVSLGLIGA